MEQELEIANMSEKGTISSEKVAEKRRYSNAFWLTHLSDISKTIYETGLRYKEWAMKYRKRQRSLVSKIRLFYFVYLTADRISENIREPQPTIRLSSLKGNDIVIINRVNEKHFTKDGNREVIPEYLYVNGIEERLMWEYIFPDDVIPEKEYSISYFMDKLLTKKSIDTDRTKLAHIMSHFKADMTDGINVYKDHGFTPHQLRHLRVYNLRFNWGYDWDLIRVWLGWDSEAMKEHYVYIRKQIKTEEQLAILKKYMDMPTHAKLDVSEYGLDTLLKH